MKNFYFILILSLNCIFNFGIKAQSVDKIPTDTLIIDRILVNNVPIDQIKDSLYGKYNGKSTLIIDVKKHNDLTFNWGFDSKNKIDTTYMFAVFLEGFDENWIMMGNNTYTRYTSLEPGFYILKIRYAINGIWSNDFTEQRLIVKPKVYQTWWAKLGMIGIVVAAIILI